MYPIIIIFSHIFCAWLQIFLNHCSDISVNEKQSTKNENANNGSNEFAIERSNPNGNESRSDTRARYGYDVLIIVNFKVILSFILLQ